MRQFSQQAAPSASDIVDDEFTPEHGCLTLPSPAKLLSGVSIDSFPARRSSLLQHHITHQHSINNRSNEEQGRSGSIPSITHLPQSHSLVEVRQPIGIEESNDILMRKRDADDMAEEVPSDSPSPTSTNATTEGTGQFCLCQRDPKIPRPRNAFILYRQHHQAAIVNQNPGLPNPDISKIIGEQWRQLPAEAKTEWKALAEEEKARHQQQYPDYRYQPRRNGRYSQSSISGPSSGGTLGPQGNCLKCGGKIMNPPNTPYPGHVVTTQAMSQQPPGFAVQQRAYAIGPVSQCPPRHQIVSPPHTAHQRPYTDHYGQPVTPHHDPRFRYHSNPPPSIQPPPPPSHQTQDSHDPKRRKFNGNGVYIPTQEAHPEHQYHYTHTPQTAVFTRSGVPAPLQSSGQPMPPPSARAIYSQPPPPSQNVPVRQSMIHHRRSPSLTLPPIKTAAASPTAMATVQAQKSGVEAMIMSIPVLNKIKILSQISPSLVAPGIASPNPEVRGAILAIEGMDAASVHSLTQSLCEQLQRDGNFAVKVFQGPDPYSALSNNRRGSRGSINGSFNPPPLTTEGCLNMIGEWHKVSRAMIEYITTRPGVTTESDVMDVDDRLRTRSRSNSVVLVGAEKANSVSTSTNQPKSQKAGHIADIDTVTANNLSTSSPPKSLESSVSPKTITKTAGLSLGTPPSTKSSQRPGNLPSIFNPPILSSDGTTFSRIPAAALLQQRRSQTPPPPPPPRQPTPPPPPPVTAAIPSSPPKSKVIVNPNAIPIAIVPHYQLTTADASSIATPITDAYSPLAHWQWLATLWRGCIGPDVTIVIKGTTDDETPTVATHQINRSGESNADTTRNNHSQPNTSTPPRAAQQQQSSTSTTNQTKPPTSTTNNIPTPTVEVRLLDSRTVIVRTNQKETAHGFGCGNTAPPLEGENWEKAKRRVGFEVAEFLRK